MPMVRVCPQCGRSNPPESPFCRNCGTSIDEVPTRDVTSMMPAGNSSTREPRRTAAASLRSEPDGVVLTGVDIPFGDLVFLLTKVALASIPAAIILAGIGFIIGIFVAAMSGV